jgi:hypothetical protein
MSLRCLTLVAVASGAAYSFWVECSTEGNGGPMNLLRSFLRLVLIGSVALASGCATAPTPTVTADRTAHTGIADADGVVVILNTVQYCENLDPCRQRTISEVRASNFEHCMDGAIAKRLPKTKVIRAREFRAAVFPGKGFADSPHTLETILLALADPDTQQRIPNLHLRYVVILDLKTEDSGSYTSGEASNAAMAIKHAWARSLELKATILDARSAQNAGSLTSKASGETGYVAGVFIALPMVFPVGHPPTESEVCTALGPAVADFVADEN